MSRDVKRYVSTRLLPDASTWNVSGAAHTYVHISDYAALEAENARLQSAFDELAERYGKLQTGEDSLLARVVTERDALAAELGQAREEIEGMHKSLDKLRAQCAGFSAYAEIDRLTAELAAIKGQEVAGGN